MMITRHRQRFSSRVVKFASQVLYSMWVHQELRDVYRKSGWKETDFVTKTIAARNARPNSPTNLKKTDFLKHPSLRPYCDFSNLAQSHTRVNILARKPSYI